MSRIKTTLLQLCILACALTIALSLNYLYASPYAWTGPTGTAPDDNVGAPINITNATQVKDGNVSVGLGTNSTAVGLNPLGLTIAGSQRVEGWLKVGDGATGNPTQLLDLTGTAGVDGIKFPDGTVQTTAGGGSLGLSFDDYLYVREEQASGVNSLGVVGNGTWGIRTLNTVVVNTIAGASLAANRITLPTGTYYIDGYGACVSGGKHRAQLYSVTGAATKIMGTSAYGRDDSYEDTTESFIKGTFTVAGASEVFEIRHRSNDGGNPGQSDAYGVAEYYTPIEIWKLN